MRLHLPLFICLTLAFAANAQDTLTPTRLRCEYLADPLGIDSAKPRLDWILGTANPAARNLSQTAYQILVASSPAVLAADRGDLWDSGEVKSAETSQIAYGGTPLTSREACYWKVRVVGFSRQAGRLERGGFVGNGPAETRGVAGEMDRGESAGAVGAKDRDTRRFPSCGPRSPCRTSRWQRRASTPRRSASTKCISTASAWAITSSRRTGRTTASASATRSTTSRRWSSPAPMRSAGCSATAGMAATSATADSRPGARSRRCSRNWK